MKIHFYAASADTIGQNNMVMDTLDITVAQLRKELQQRFAQARSLLAVCVFVIDNRIASDDTVVSADAEVDVLPPFAGG